MRLAQNRSLDVLLATFWFYQNKKKQEFMHFNFLLADQKTRFRYEVAAAGGKNLLFRCVTDVDFTLDTV